VTSDTDIRMECLRIASSGTWADDMPTLERAKRLYLWTMAREPQELPSEPDTREPRRFMDDKPKAAALDKLQNLGQEFDRDLRPIEAAAEPAWKRARVGDFVKLDNAQIARVVSTGGSPGACLMCEFDGKFYERWWVSDYRVRSILPTPPRHGDFGSMYQEDGA
jgi:hypothetical protein